MNHATLTRARRIMQALAQLREDGTYLTGRRATGTITVRSTAGTPSICRGSICVPIMGSASGDVGQVDYQRPLFVTADTVLSTAGVTVPISSIVGGARHNTLPSGTKVRWFPPHSEVEATSVILDAPTGGDDSGLVKSVLLYEQMHAQAAEDLFKAAAHAYPAIVLAWEDTGGYERKGPGVVLRFDRWSLYVVVSRLDAYERRGADGLEILDAAEELLTERSSADGLRVSAPPLEITSRGRRGISPQTFVYVMSFATYRTVKRDDASTKVKSTPWEVSNIDVQSVDKTVVDDSKHDMTD